MHYFQNKSLHLLRLCTVNVNHVPQKSLETNKAPVAELQNFRVGLFSHLQGEAGQPLKPFKGSVKNTRAHLKKGIWVITPRSPSNSTLGDVVYISQSFSVFATLFASSKFLPCNWHQIKILMKNPSFFQFFVASLTRSSIFYPRNLRNDELRPGIPPPPGERERRKSKPAMTNKGKATSPKTPSKGLGLSGWCTLNCSLFWGGWDAWFWLGCCWKWFGLLMFWVTCANLWLWLLWQMATGFYWGAYS